MKSIGIIGAMDEEILSIKENMDVISTRNIIGLDFFLGKMNGNNVVLVRSGIGKVNAAVCTQVLIDMYGVDYIINVGVAGAISKELEIGDIVISSQCIEHDFDTSALGDPVGFISRLNVSFFKADDELIEIAKQAGESACDSKVVVGTIASGDQFIASNEKKSIIWKEFKASCAEMEGAAIAHTCFLNMIPFVIIRSISDKAEDSSEHDYEKFFRQSADIASKIVVSMTKSL